MYGLSNVTNTNDLGEFEGHLSCYEW